MSLLSDKAPHGALPSSSSTTTMAASNPTKPRSSTVSRNDLFTTSWQPELPPPKPMLNDMAIPPLPSSTVSGYAHAHTLPSPVTRKEMGLKMDLDGLPNEFGHAKAELDEFGVPLIKSTPQLRADKGGGNISPSPRTSSFFDMPSETMTPPPPAPKVPAVLHTSTGSSSFAPSPLTLSRSSSLRRAPPPLPLIGADSISTMSAGPSRQHSGDSYTDPLSPLHQSPQLPPSSSGGLEGWQPPLPPSSDDIEMRLLPNSTYLLGEGRYARVFLASYKQSTRKSKGRARNLLGRAGHQQDRVDLRVNGEGDGMVGSSWKLCAAKRLAPDRESQTMGLREAFFLNRLAGNGQNSIYGSKGLKPRQRAVSPLRGSHAPPSLDETISESRNIKIRPKPQVKSNGSVYVVKLIAVKEDSDVPLTNPAHARSSSDALAGATPSDATTATVGLAPTDLRRQRSSTLINAQTPPNLSTTGRGELAHLSSFPSLPSLAYASRNESAPSLSRLVLLLEHAPLGTLDRMLRTSPQLVGRGLWERWAREGAEALEWVHGKGVVHADIKPGNLLLTTDLHIRLSDFGSSLLIHPAHPPTDGLGLGTLPFSPPELVDPNQSFSFPVDVFALGATLYQCLTGREPFRGVRTVEMMHHVRKGALWTYEERERLHRVGNDDGVSTAGSPYPSAWRGSPSATTGAGYPSGHAHSNSLGGGVRRAGSLRVPPSHSRDHLAAVVEKPRLKRMTSAESLRASDDAGSSESPAGVKLWANWVKAAAPASASGSTPVSGPGVDAIGRLLADGEEPDLTSPTYGISRVSSMRQAQESRLTPGSRPRPLRGNSSGSCSDSGSASSPSPLPSPYPEPRLQGPTPESTGPSTPLDMETEEGYMDAEAAFAHAKVLSEPYEDGSPSMVFLDGLERVSEEVREVLRRMLLPDQWERMSIVEVRQRWDELGVGVGDGEME
ncbi:hypothetical protein IAU60_002784 [Kwoniella sp. DSM 27419]